MIPRLRSMTLDSERVALVLDRMGAIGPEKATAVGAQIQGMAERLGLAGGLVFGFEVALDDATEEGITIYADELAALRRLAEVVAGTAGADWRPADRETLRLLIERAEQ